MTKAALKRAREWFETNTNLNIPESVAELLDAWAQAAVTKSQKECLDWVTGYAGPTDNDEFIEKLLQGIQRREESAAQEARREALEEAAQVAESNPPTDLNWSWNREELAKWIRALASQPASDARREALEDAANVGMSLAQRIAEALMDQNMLDVPVLTAIFPIEKVIQVYLDELGDKAIRVLRAGEPSPERGKKG
jgi:hypothetical protein